jgi:hypothetical protein
MLAMAEDPLGNLAVIASSPAQPASYVVLKDPEEVVIGLSKTAPSQSDEIVTDVSAVL